MAWTTRTCKRKTETVRFLKFLKTVSLTFSDISKTCFFLEMMCVNVREHVFALFSNPYTGRYWSAMGSLTKPQQSVQKRLLKLVPSPYFCPFLLRSFLGERIPKTHCATCTTTNFSCSKWGSAVQSCFSRTRPSATETASVQLLLSVAKFSCSTKVSK